MLTTALELQSDDVWPKPLPGGTFPSMSWASVMEAMDALAAFT